MMMVAALIIIIIILLGSLGGLTLAALPWQRREPPRGLCMQMARPTRGQWMLSIRCICNSMGAICLSGRPELALARLGLAGAH